MIPHPLPTVAPFALPHLADTAAARTIARRLDRLGIADTDNDSTAAWVHDLELYEALMEKEQRMALYVGQTRRVDRETGEVTHGHDDDLAEAAWRAFVTDLGLWRAHAEQAGRILAMLDGALDALAATPHDDPTRWARSCGYWSSIRHGPFPRPLPPVAPWSQFSGGTSYRQHMDQGWLLMIVVRDRYRPLTKESKRAARQEFGIGEPQDIYHVIAPLAQRDALDQRAQSLSVSHYWSTTGPGSYRKRAA